MSHVRNKDYMCCHVRHMQTCTYDDEAHTFVLYVLTVYVLHVLMVYVLTVYVLYVLMVYVLMVYVLYVLMVYVHSYMYCIVYPYVLYISCPGCYK